MNLTDLQHSVFLQALGSAILNSLWQTLILWLLYETACASYKNASSRFKNNLSTIFLFFSFVLFSSTLVFEIYKHTNAVIMPVAGTLTVIDHNDNSALGNLFSKIATSLPYLSAAYILLLLFLTVKLFNAYRYVYLISNKHLIAPPEYLQHFASNLAKQLKPSKKISVWISEHIDVPATVGFIKPIILIPVASLNHLSGEQLEAIILHELSHIRRNDFITNILISVVETILFFNPFVAMLSKAAKRERENCCDDFVLKFQYDPHSYATALLRLEQSRITSMKLALGAVSGKKQLLSRIRRITNDTKSARQLNYGQKLMALLLVTAIICSIAWLSPQETPSLKTSEVKNKAVPLQLSPVNDPVTLQSEKKDGTMKNQTVKHEKKNTVPAPDLTEDNFSDTLKNILPDTFSKELKNLVLNAALASSKFVLDEKKFKLPDINVKNFFPGNTNFSINLSNINFSQLNNGLAEAYKQINAVDWKKVGSDINKAFNQAHLDKLATKEQMNKWMEGAKEYSKQLEEKAKEMQLQKISLEQLRIQKQLQSHDSLMLTTFINNSSNDCNNSYEYTTQNFTNSTTSMPVFFISSPKHGKVNVKRNTRIFVRHPRNIKYSQVAPRLLQFTFNQTSKNPSPESMVNMVITDNP